MLGNALKIFLVPASLLLFLSGTRAAVLPLPDLEVKKALFAELADYILGPEVRGLEAKDGAGNCVSRPQWTQVIRRSSPMRSVASSMSRSSPRT